MPKDKILRRDDWMGSGENQRLLTEMWGDYIDWQKRREGEKGWLVKQLKRFKCQKIFDSCVGDGCDAIYLIKQGFDVGGNDIDEAFVQRALENAKKANIQLKITNLDWRELAKEIPGQTFDAVFCLGNSLACLHKNQATALKQFYTILKDGGILIIDERNYQYVLDNRDEILKGNFRYSGKYLYCGKYVHSRPIEIEEGKVKYEIHDERINKKAYMVVYPFKRGELKELLQKVGFKNIEQYSDYQPGDNPEADFYFYVCQR